ncbi:unnamed protein product [Ectocarpus sp. CCAP 1310/34]|nr:unnamed protein product [Ectocarpus sp. CCAP 1310/34]
MEERRASAATASAPMSCGSGSSSMCAGPMQQQQQQGMGCTRDWRNVDAAGGDNVGSEPRRFHRLLSAIGAGVLDTSASNAWHQTTKRSTGSTTDFTGLLSAIGVGVLDT